VTIENSKHKLIKAWDVWRFCVLNNNELYFVKKNNLILFQCQAAEGDLDISI
jgi:hypothetical protein